MTKTITDVNGVYASGINCGVKFKRKDLAFIFVPEAYATAGVFTRNQFPAPCVNYNRACIARGPIKAVIVNSGNANAATGKSGMRDTKKMAQLAAKRLEVLPHQVAVASTGIIGVPMPMDKIQTGIQHLLQDFYKKEGLFAAEAILTTDTGIKSVYETGMIGGTPVVVSGITKGSGMLAPNMATTLTYLVTNAVIAPKRLQQLFVQAIDETFNMTSVDTDTSTNDMALLIATKTDGVKIKSKKEIAQFYALLKQALMALCKMIATDGEGATKLIEAHVCGAANRADARAIAKNIIDSPLVKTAIHGSDPNWGRVIAAAGKTFNAKINPDRVELYFGDIKVFSKGQRLTYNSDVLISYLRQRNVFIRLDLNLGRAAATAWGCDLTKGYIDINTQYS